MTEVQELQEEVYSNVMNFYYMNDSDKMIHIKLLEKLIDKQKIMYARLSLSDDPEAQEMKEQILSSAVMMGLPKNIDMTVFFNQMSEMINMMKQQLDISKN